MRLIHDLQKRLAELESRLPREQTDKEKLHAALQFFLIDAAGYYLGDPRPREAPITAFARALGGYEDQRELLKALELKARHGQVPEFDKKWHRAICKLFAKFGVDLATSDWKEIVEALKRMEAGLSDYRERLQLPRGAA